MAYSSDIANIVADQLAKLVTLNRHQLAGQVANLDFWLGEVRHCLEVIDGYNRRFDQLKAAQKNYVTKHRTVEFDTGKPWCSGNLERPASKVRRVPDDELSEARCKLCDATCRFLVRCCKEGMIPESVLLENCAQLGIRVEPRDLSFHD